MTPETQSQLTDLARRGAKCKAWAEWCKMVLWEEFLYGHYEYHEVPKKGDEVFSKVIVRAHDDQVNGVGYVYESDTCIGPLPSTSFLDDQLGEFLERAGVTFSEGRYWMPNKDATQGIECVHTAGRGPGAFNTMNQLKAAMRIVEDAHGLNGFDGQQAAPYMKAFNKGIGE